MFLSWNLLQSISVLLARGFLGIQKYDDPTSHESRCKTVSYQQMQERRWILRLGELQYLAVGTRDVSHSNRPDNPTYCMLQVANSVNDRAKSNILKENSTFKAKHMLKTAGDKKG